MAKYRHLNSEDRSHIETDLNNRQSFKGKRNNGRTMTRINLFCRMRLGNY